MLLLLPSYPHLSFFSLSLSVCVHDLVSWGLVVTNKSLLACDPFTENLEDAFGNVCALEIIFSGRNRESLTTCTSQYILLTFLQKCFFQWAHLRFDTSLSKYRLGLEYSFPKNKTFEAMFIKPIPLSLM